MLIIEHSKLEKELRVSNGSVPKKTFIVFRTRVSTIQRQRWSYSASTQQFNVEALHRRKEEANEQETTDCGNSWITILPAERYRLACDSTSCLKFQGAANIDRRWQAYRRQITETKGPDGCQAAIFSLHSMLHAISCRSLKKYTRQNLPRPHFKAIPQITKQIH